MPNRPRKAGGQYEMRQGLYATRTAHFTTTEGNVRPRVALLVPGHEGKEHQEESTLTSKRDVSLIAHPVVAATFPGFCGFAIGIIFSVCGSAMGYRFGQLFVPMEYPDADPEPMMVFGVVMPWALFLGFFAIGFVLMRFYRRSLRQNHDLLVSRLLLPKGERQRLPVLQYLRMEWPYLALGLIMLGVVLYGDSAQGAAWSMSCIGGLLASLIMTYKERKRIYDDAVTASVEVGAIDGSPSSARNLPPRAKVMLVSLSVIVCGFAIFFVWNTGRIVELVGNILEITSPQ